MDFPFTEGEYDISTRAEIDLLLAEVALKGLASTGKSAGDHIADALIHSTDFWYSANQAAWVASKPPTTPPSYTEFPALTNKMLVWERFRYPSTQISWNKEEFSKVEQDDNWVNPIFWVPQSKRAEPYFLSKAIKD